MMRSWFQTAILRNIPEFLQLVGLHRPIQRIIRYLIEFRIPRVFPTILRVLPHDPKVFTQGLDCYGARLFESTGPLDSSSLQELSPTDGSTLQYILVPEHHAEWLRRTQRRSISTNLGMRKLHEKLGHLLPEWVISA